jgi:hypothetical protein
VNCDFTFRSEARLPLKGGLAFLFGRGEMKRIVLTLAFISVLLLPLTAHAVDSYWIGQSGWWDDASMWNPPGVPEGEGYWHNPPSFAYITPNDALDRTINYRNTLDNQGPFPDAVTMASGGSGVITFNQAQDWLYSPRGVTIGANVTYNQSGGGISVYYGNVSIGPGAVYNLSNDGYLIAEGTLYNAGTVNQTGGSVQTVGGGQIQVSGTYNISGGGFGASDLKIKTGGMLNIDNTGLADGGMLVTNDGTVNLSGGTLRTKYGINNNGLFNFSGGTYQSQGLYSGSLFNNTGTFNLSGDGTRTVDRDVVNTGTVKTTNTTVVYTGTFTNNGAYISDPAAQYFNDLVIGQTGYIKGGLLDFFYIGGDFKNQSTMNTAWNTSLAYLGFVDGADSLHDFHLAGVDYGASLAGYSDNFSWGFLDLRGDFLKLYDGNDIAGGALYAGDIFGLQILDHLITNITGMDGLNIYYLADLWGNNYLHGLTYDLAGGGHLIPIGLASVPEPATVLLLGCSLIGLAGLRRKFKK